MVPNLHELAANLGPVFKTEEAFIATLYQDLVTANSIDAFLDAPQSPFRRTKVGSSRGRWTGIPELAKLQGKILRPLLTVIEQVRDAFSLKKALPSGVSRVIRDTHEFDLRHENGLKMRPDIVVAAEGPSFETPSRMSQCFVGFDDLGYTNAACVFEVKTERSKDTDQDIVEQLGLHCQQMFNHQPNRTFSRALLITERTIRLIHYDRTGVYITPSFDYHNEPHTFVRLILGLNSFDESVLGFDTTIRWHIEHGRKVSGTITTVPSGNGVQQTPVVYKMKELAPVFLRSAVCGRGTTCWLVKTPAGKNLVIKDSWRTGTRMAEHEYLEAAKGVAGVARMVSYQYLGQTSDSAPSMLVSVSAPEHRTQLRIVLEAHGPSLNHYRSRYQLVAALRSAIKAHRELHSAARVLHRDISVLNILLGTDDDVLDGFLIDLDMAVFHDCPPREISAQMKTGTHIYQSIAVLLSYRIKNGDPVPPHDYLDDLESFFYVLSEIMLKKVSDGEKVNEDAQDIIKLWTAMDDTKAQDGKTYFIRQPFDPAWVDLNYWGEACVQLLEGFHAFMERVIDEKALIRVKRIPQGDKIELFKAMGLNGRLDEHYDALDALFEKALEALKIEEPVIEARLAAAKAARPVPPPPPPASPILHVVSKPIPPTRRVSKRRLKKVDAVNDVPPMPRRVSKRRLEQGDEAEAVEPPPKRRSTRVRRQFVPFVNWK